MAGIIDRLLDSRYKDSVDGGAKLWMYEPLTPIDKAWLKNSYLINVNDLMEDDRPNAYWTNAYLKYVDTSLGGNFGVNVKYGFTPSADVPIAGRLAGREEYDSQSRTMNFGMGRRYSEMFDDNEQILFIELGDAKHNSLLQYVAYAIDYGTAVVANTGRSLAGYYAGKAFGTIVGVAALFMAFPVWGAALFLAFAGTMWFMSVGNDFSYYSLQTNMTKYWRAVNIMVTQIGIELGILTPEFLPKEANSKDLGLPMKVTSEFMDEVKNLLPGIINENGYIDIFAVANKTQRLINNQKSEEREYYNSVGPNGEAPKIITYADEIIAKEATTFSSYIDEVFKFSRHGSNIIDDTEAKTDNSGALEAIEKNNTNDKNVSLPKPKSTINADQSITLSEAEIQEKSSWFGEMFNYVDSAARHGANFATFRVEYTGSVSETFSNSTTEIPIKSMVNSVGGKVRQLKFSASGGNIGGETLTNALKLGVDTVMGAIEGVTFGFSNIVSALMGGGYYIVPDMWENSTFELQKHTFKLRFGGPYGHPLSLLQDVFTPIAMLICAIAAQSVGKAGYTSPMLCSPFIKGIMNSPLAIMDSLTIERGIGNMGFDKRGRPLAAEVSFSFLDLAPMVTMPVHAGLLAPITSGLDDSSPMSRYIQLLAGRDLYTTKYFVPKAKLRYMKARQGLSQLTDPSYWGTMMGNSMSDGVIGSLVQGFTLPPQLMN